MMIRNKQANPYPEDHVAPCWRAPRGALWKTGHARLRAAHKTWRLTSDGSTATLAAWRGGGQTRLATSRHAHGRRQLKKRAGMRHAADCGKTEGSVAAARERRQNASVAPNAAISSVISWIWRIFSTPTFKQPADLLYAGGWDRTGQERHSCWDRTGRCWAFMQRKHATLPACATLPTFYSPFCVSLTCMCLFPPPCHHVALPILPSFFCITFLHLNSKQALVPPQQPPACAFLPTCLPTLFLCYAP